MSQQDEYITFEDAASILGVSRRTIDRYVERGWIKRYRRLFRVVLSRADVESLAQVKPEEKEEGEH